MRNVEFVLSMADPNFICNLCNYSTDTYLNFKNHYVRNHKNDSKFYVACNIDGCGYSTKKWDTFKVHVHRHHKKITSISNRNADITVPNDVLADNLQLDCDDSMPFNPRYFNSSFTLALESKLNLSQTAVDCVVSTTSILLENHIALFRNSLKERLRERQIDERIIDDIPVETLVDEFNSSKKRQKFYEQNYNAYLMPKGLLLGKKFVTRKGVIKEIDKIGYLVPFKENLQNLLSMPEVWHEVQNPHYSNKEFMFDICDGDYIQGHPLFMRNPKALQIILNCDDMEIVNPLGSHVKKHKLSMFYWTLANIKPEYRSRLNVIQLLAIGRTVDVRCHDALSKILDDFINVVNELSQGGIQMDINGFLNHIEGTLVIVPADTLGSNWLGMFKEGVSFALKGCRQCDIEGTKMRNVIVSSQCCLRTMEGHIERCELLKETSKEASKYWSKLWGINGESVLLKLIGFPLVSGLVQDPMHILMEGIIPNELGNLLFHLVYVKKYFTLKWLNTAIAGFSYSYLHIKSKPEPIQKHHIDGISGGKIKQTAAAMWTLCQILPFIIGPKIPRHDPNWHNTLRMIQICIFGTSSYCARETSSLLSLQIAQYLSEVKSLYPKSSFTPKMHYLVHLPQQMLSYGPLRHHWCMRFEAKHSYFSQKKYKNFKNLPYTLAKRHQVYMCHVQSDSKGNRALNFLYEGDSVGLGEKILLGNVYQDLQNLQAYSLPPEVYFTRSATIHGLEYKNGCALVLKYEDESPNFVIVNGIVVANHIKYFILEETEGYFDEHILAYKLQSKNSFFILSFQDLTYKWPLSMYKYEDDSAVMNVCSHTCEFL